MHFCQFFFHRFFFNSDRSDVYYITTANLYRKPVQTKDEKSDKLMPFFCIFSHHFFVNSAVRKIIVLGEPLHVVLIEISKVIDVMSYFDILHVLSKFLGNQNECLDFHEFIDVTSRNHWIFPVTRQLVQWRKRPDNCKNWMIDSQKKKSLAVSPGIIDVRTHLLPHKIIA